MKHRIVHEHGFGANAKVWLNNQGPLNPQFGDAALDYLELTRCDFQIDDNQISVGIEPTYQFDRLHVLTIHRQKDKSGWVRGKAFGAYGSQVVTERRILGDYKYQSKFVRFVDKWHPILFPK
jgi:hypothetical protein